MVIIGNELVRCSRDGELNQQRLSRYPFRIICGSHDVYVKRTSRVSPGRDRRAWRRYAGADGFRAWTQKHAHPGRARVGGTVEVSEQDTSGGRITLLLPLN